MTMALLAIIMKIEEPSAEKHQRFILVLMIVLYNHFTFIDSLKNLFY